jgi:heterodisulfide reductase subunit A-like polyferredoxin
MDKCTACGDCTQVCPVSLESLYDECLIDRKAVYKPYAQAVPGAYTIDKRDQSPCTNACPNAVNAHGYVAMIAQGKYQEALEVITRTLPLPGVLGRICPHPCETACRRDEVDEPISICALKRFVADQVDIDDLPIVDITTRNERIAVIGAGPAGLTAAYFLAKDGFKVTIFEALPVAGGMLRVGIPDYRLPPDVLEKEIKWITRFGVEIKYNTVLGRDITVDGLMDDGYKAVYLAIGCHANMKLNIPNEDTDGVIPGVKFLRDVSLGDLKILKGNVVIVGGGDVAIDAARSALRLGADKVSILYRRTHAEMPAREEEIEDALEEGVDIQFLMAPVEVVERGGKVVGLKCIKMKLGEPDKSGRRRPVPVEGSEFVVDTDVIIPAIGQKTDTAFLKDTTDIELDRWNNIKVDPISFETTKKGVFAGGDAQTGAWIAIGAVAAGREAAVSISRYLNGEDLTKGREPIETPQKNFYPIKKDIQKVKRAKMSRISMEDRKTDFTEVEQGLSEAAAVAEAQKCLNCMVCCECLECVKVCKAEAVTIETHSQKNKTVGIDVGSIILAPGADVYDPGLHDTYNYTKHPNVVTSMEFERILSASGPYGGHLIRPSDHVEPKKIAWLQCVGSRDVHLGAHGFCSGVCCTYAIKEAMLAKEHSSNGLDAAVFYIDMRTFGKDFEQYYNRAREESGVRFVKSKITNVESNDETGMQVIRYVDEAGRRLEEEFDMVVLSVGLSASLKTAEQAKKWGIDLDHYNFASTNSFDPVKTSRPGIYVCGIFQGPKDIPSSVIDSSAAAGVAGSSLADVRWTLTKTREIPEEKDVRGEPPRIGVFVCRCGTNIAGTVDVPEVTEFAKGLPGVVYAEENMFSCSQDTQDKMTEIIKEHGLNRVVVAACTPKTHEPLFQETLINAGINKYLFEMGNIRNQCSWVHKDDPERATKKSKDIVRMAVAKAGLLEPLMESTMGITQSVLVIGGGVAGMAAARNMSEQGYHTYLIEKADALGGQARHLHETWRGEDIQGYLTQLTDAVQSDDNIEVFVNARISHVDGFVGNFKTTIHQNGDTRVLEHGVTIIASGASELKPAGYLYGQDSRVVTGLELQQRFIDKDPLLDQADTAVFIQCVGSRIPERPYCSKVCCTQSIKSAMTLKEINPQMNVFILYRDMRPYGLREDLYREARSAGIRFIRYNSDKEVDVTNGAEGLKVSFSDRVLQRVMDIRPDLLVLASAVVPPAENPLAQLYKVPVNADGFFAEAHVKLRPVDFATDGVFVCGLAHAPKPIDESITQAQAAVSRAVTLLSKKAFLTSGIVAETNPLNCSSCGVCVSVCPYSAPGFIEKGPFTGKAQINPVLCKGCGLCVASCRSGAIRLKGFDNNQIFAQIFALDKVG